MRIPAWSTRFRPRCRAPARSGCGAHFARNLLTRVPKSAQSFVATIVRSIFAQPDGDSGTSNTGGSSPSSTAASPRRRRVLEEAGPEILTFTSFPKEHWRQLWSNNSLERLNKEIRRRTDVVGIVPDRPSIVRLGGACSPSNRTSARSPGAT